MKTATRPASGRAKGHVPEDQVSAQHRRGKKADQQAQVAEQDQRYAPKQQGGWVGRLESEEQRRLAACRIQRSGKEAQNTPAEPGPGRDSRHGSGRFASVYVFRTQVHSLICCQLLLVTNNIDNEPPFVRRRDI